MLVLREWIADNTFRRMGCILDQTCLYIKYGVLGGCIRKLVFTISQVHPKAHHSVVLSIVLKTSCKNDFISVC